MNGQKQNPVHYLSATQGVFDRTKVPRVRGDQRFKVRGLLARHEDEAAASTPDAVSTAVARVEPLLAVLVTPAHRTR